jgi:hypothetical protein
MRARSTGVVQVVTFQTCLALLGSGLALSACSSSGQADIADVALDLGALSLPITATGASGAVYRLRQAVFEVRLDGPGGGPPSFITSEQDPLASTLVTRVPSGVYAVGLREGWSLERAFGSDVRNVPAQLRSSVFQRAEVVGGQQTFVRFSFEALGDLLEFGPGELGVEIDVSESGPPAVVPVSFGALIQTSPVALQSFSLRSVLDGALDNAGMSSSATDAYHAIIDSYASAAQGQDPTATHCDDPIQANGDARNGFGVQCDRLESQQFDNLDDWFPIAAVNRLDLAVTDGFDCGQQRLVFANDEAIGNGRMFMSIEALIPNPEPFICGVDACLPIAQFWSSVDAETDPIERSNMLHEAFLGAGIGNGFGPFMNVLHLGASGAGQIRTNNFNDSPWTLREFAFRLDGTVRPLPVRDAVNGALWNDLLPSPTGEACRADFLSAMGGLLTNNLAELSFPSLYFCNDDESRNDGSQDYVAELQAGSGAFRDQLDAALIGTGLQASDVAARARFAGSCIGCHREASGSALGGGVTAPTQTDFVHVSERSLIPCDDGVGQCFEISSALRGVFLPHRQQVLQSFLTLSPGCDVTPLALAADGVGANDASALPLLPKGIGSTSPADGRANAPLRTLGGQLASPHAH